MKTIYRILLLMIFTALSFQGFAYDTEVDGIYYNINVADKTASVTSGDKNYTGDIVIPSTVFYANQNLPVTSIEHEAFSRSSITSIKIPNSVTEIGTYAFAWCIRIVSVEIPNSITEIGDGTFYDCRELSTINLPSSLKIIGSSAFSYTSLLSIDIPDSVTTIKSYAFSSINTLVSVNLPISLTFLGWRAFYKSENLVSVDLPNSLKSLGSSVFEDCTSLTSVNFPESLSSIGSSAFQNCKSLISVNFPESLSSIGSSAFQDCSSLISVNFPESISSTDSVPLAIGSSAFQDCKSLISVNLPSSLNKIGEAAFIRCKSLKIDELPNSLQIIEAAAFMECKEISKLKIHDSMSTIQYSAFAFYTIGTLEIPSSYDSFDLHCFSGWYTNGSSIHSIIRNVILVDSPKKIILQNKDDLDYFQIEDFYLGREVDGRVNLGDALKTLSLGPYIINSNIKFEYSPNLEIINSLSYIPSQISGITNTQYATIQVNIPVGSLENYMADSNWNKFWNFNEVLEVNAEKIVLNIKTVKVVKGDTFQLNAEIIPWGAQNHNVTWTSSNPDIATVSETGLVTALNYGTTIITAAYENLYTECEIIVPGEGGIESIFENSDTEFSVWTIDGYIVKKNCNAEDLKSLPKGIYIIVSGNQRYKISI